MMIKPTVDLQNLAILADLPPHELEQLQGRLRFWQYIQGEYLFSAREDASALYFLLDGLVKVTFMTPDGDEKIIDIFEAGDVFGHLFLGKYPFRIGHALAIRSSYVCKLSEADFRELITCCPTLSMNFIHHLVDQQRETFARMHALLQADARSRLLGTLLSLARRHDSRHEGQFILNPAITQEDLANMSGLNRSTVSSLINQFRRESIMGGTGRSLSIRPEVIERILAETGFELLE